MKQSMKSRRGLLFGSTLGAAILLAGAFVIMVNYLGARHYKRFDWTQSHLYTLSEKSLNILAELDQEIDVVVFMDGSSEVFEPVKELLARYEAASPRITVRSLDPVKNPAEAQQLVDEFEIQRADVVVFKGAGDKRVVEGVDLAEYDYSGLQMGGAAELEAFKGEQLFTSAILELVEQRKPTIVFTAGHGEARLDEFEAGGLSGLRDFLGQDNFDLETWGSLGQAAVPEGTDLVVIAGPTAAFNEQEVGILEEFLGGGGRILVLLDPTLTGESRFSDTGIKEWLAGYGVVVEDGIVVDPAKLMPFFGAETIFADSYGIHTVTEALRQARLPAVFALARPVRAEEGAAGTVVELVMTSAEGWGETDLDDLANVAKGDEDIAGPVPLAVSVELASVDGAVGPDGEGSETGMESEPVAEPASPGRLIVFGDSDFATNGQLSQAGNATLIANTLNWLVERESHLGIAPKEPEQVRLSLTPSQRRLFAMLVIVGLPGAALATGITVFVRRRR